jgi:hypothetical protein
VKRILAIASLTWKSAFRFRLFWILAALLLGAVIGLPLMLKDDGTAKGLTQILLTYTLSCVAALLGIATLWLSCGTLAKDIEECQLQVVTVKPISRWQLWLGKWLGVVGLDALLLALSGVAIFALLVWRAGHLSPDERQIVKEDIFVARASMKERVPDLQPAIEEAVQKRVKEIHPNESELAEIRKQISEEIIAAYTEVPPGYRRQWVIDMHTLSGRTKDEPLQLRIKFHTPILNSEKSFDTAWIIGPPDSQRQVLIRDAFPADSFQEFLVPPHLLDDQGRLFINFINPNDVAVTFPMDDGFEVLYYENTFGVNFVRGLAIILCWLGLLSAIGLAAASELTFPVAAFVAIAVLIMGLSSGTIQTVVDNGTITNWDAQSSGFGHSPLDLIVIPTFRISLKIINLVEGFSPIDCLSSGRSITWGMLGSAVAQIVVLLGGFFALVGIILFARRELATAQGNT